MFTLTQQWASAVPQNLRSKNSRGLPKAPMTEGLSADLSESKISNSTGDRVHQTHQQQDRFLTNSILCHFNFFFFNEVFAINRVGIDFSVFQKWSTPSWIPTPIYHRGLWSWAHLTTWTMGGSFTDNPTSSVPHPVDTGFPIPITWAATRPGSSCYGGQTSLFRDTMPMGTVIRGCLEPQRGPSTPIPRKHLVTCYYLDSMSLPTTQAAIITSMDGLDFIRTCIHARSSTTKLHPLVMTISRPLSLSTCPPWTEWIPWTWEPMDREPFSVICGLQ